MTRCLLFLSLVAALLVPMTLPAQHTISLPSVRGALMRNNGDTVLYRGDTAVRDTNWTQIHLGVRLAIPDTFARTAAGDTLPNGLNWLDQSRNYGPFILIMRTHGTASSDTVIIRGLTQRRHNLAVGLGDADTTTDTRALAGGNYRSPHRWLRIDTVRSVTTGADSVSFRLIPLLGVRRGDSTLTGFVGLVGADSIEVDSTGLIVSTGPTVARVDSASGTLLPGSFLQPSNRGTVALIRLATADTTGLGGPTGTFAGPTWNNRRIIGFSYDFKLTGTGTDRDSIFVELDPSRGLP